MSWESTLLYYKEINQAINKELSFLHSAKIVLYSVDFEEIELLQKTNKWNEAANILSLAALNIEKAGANFLLICTNTMHKVYPLIQSNINIPIIHIADATANVLQNDNISKIGLLGTSFTMKEDFYKKRLLDKYNIEVLIPNDEDINIIHKIIYEELCLGIIKTTSRNKFLKIIDKLAKAGAKAIILGCTEICTLVKDEDTNIKLYDTTKIHALEAVKMSLK